MDGNSSLEGVKVGDVVGWAPTSDVLGTSTNMCTGETFSFDHILVSNSPDSGKENDTALKQLLDGEVDALWICKYYSIIVQHVYVMYCKDSCFELFSAPTMTMAAAAHS